MSRMDDGVKGRALVLDRPVLGGSQGVEGKKGKKKKGRRQRETEREEQRKTRQFI